MKDFTPVLKNIEGMDTPALVVPLPGVSNPEPGEPIIENVDAAKTSFEEYKASTPGSGNPMDFANTQNYIAQSPITQPPVVQPPVSQPVQSPATQPSIVQPPMTQVPENQPPVTENQFTQPNQNEIPFNQESFPQTQEMPQPDPMASNQYMPPQLAPTVIMNY